MRIVLDKKRNFWMCTFCSHLMICQFFAVLERLFQCTTISLMFIPCLVMIKSTPQLLELKIQHSSFYTFLSQFVLITLEFRFSNSSLTVVHSLWTRVGDSPAPTI